MIKTKLRISPEKYIQNVMQKLHMNNAKLVSLRLIVHVKFSSDHFLTKDKDKKSIYLLVFC